MKLIEREKLELVGGWSCDERNRAACRNGHGCHCREITALRNTVEYWKEEARKPRSLPRPVLAPTEIKGE